MRHPIIALAALLAVSPFAQAQDPFAGRWTAGEWTSDGGHRGPLRATLTPTATGYDARFAGRFALVVPFVYRTHLDVVGTCGETVFLAAERRIPLFGSFRTDAVVTPATFDATFRSGRDSGRFTLRR